MKKKEGKTGGAKGTSPAKGGVKGGKPNAGASAGGASGAANFDKFEAILSKSTFINGNALSQDDADVVQQLKPSMFDLSPAKHPYVFGWFTFANRFNEKV